MPSKDVAKASVAKLVNLSEEAIKNVVHVISKRWATAEKIMGNVF